ncbi:hypothetical protein [Dongshaea marina]|uniref:hypothetical protein n=1 Tax=Dongshaea marina TaxID=2047966 RepID=UPI00131EE1F5|nr:hypothetical protein [Dongshaea marina]
MKGKTRFPKTVAPMRQVGAFLIGQNLSEPLVSLIIESVKASQAGAFGATESFKAEGIDTPICIEIPDL